MDHLRYCELVKTNSVLLMSVITVLVRVVMEFEVVLLM